MSKKLGAFFSNSEFYLTEVENQSLKSLFSITHNLFAKTDSPSDKEVPEDIKFVGNVQKSLREQKVTTTDVVLALSSHDVIFRSFIIPWVSANEVKNIVEFEVRKYIPFKLDEIAYTYFSSIFNEKAIRKIRIYFVAIRHDLLDKYCGLLEQSGLKVSSIEPASLSLLRCLLIKTKSLQDQKLALIEILPGEGKILIIDQGIPQFIRDFTFTTNPAAIRTAGDEAELINARIFNEVRISLDYFSRQFTQEKINHLIIIAQNPSPELTKSLQDDLGIPTQAFDHKELLNIAEAQSIHYLNSFGACLKDSIALPIKFDLAQGPTKPQKTEFKLKLSKEDIIGLAQVLGICAAIVGLTIGGTKFLGLDSQKKLTELSAKQGLFKDLDSKKIEEKISAIEKTTLEYRSVNTESHLAYFLAKIPKMLPKGVWIKDLQISLRDLPQSAINEQKGLPSTPEDKDILVPRIFIEMNGLAYNEILNQQIKIVNSFITNLRNDPDFAENFNKISLKSATSVTIKDKSITAFSITCE